MRKRILTVIAATILIFIAGMFLGGSCASEPTSGQITETPIPHGP